MIRAPFPLSYPWAHQKVMLKLRDMLLAHGFQVWMDVDQMSDRDNIFDSMAAAVEQASVVVVCISQEYVQSENCRLECQYVSNLQLCMQARQLLMTLCRRARITSRWCQCARTRPLYQLAGLA